MFEGKGPRSAGWEGIAPEKLLSRDGAELVETDDGV